MTIHYLHLHPGPFHLIESGQKTIESRLFDEKRQQYRVGDTLIFSNRADEQQQVEVTITKLHHAASFDKLFGDQSVRAKCSTDSIDKLLDGINQYYSAGEQQKHGVVGIEFRKILAHTD